MILIIGLGNPGIKYKKTRHNTGFEAIDIIANFFQFPSFKFQSIFKAETSKGEIGKNKVTLVKPQTFMNDSGASVKLLAGRNKVPASNLIVIHDDIDLPAGKIKISKDRGAAGHKGAGSIIKLLKTKNFLRIRIGIQPGRGKPKEAEKFVLKKFTKEETEKIKGSLEQTKKAVETALNEGFEKAMNEYNG